MTNQQTPPFNAPVDAATAATGLPVFDHLAALSRLDDDKELLATLLVMAFENIPKTIAHLEETLLNGDAIQVKLEAHKLKGVAATVGAAALARVAMQIQSLAADNQLALIGASLVALKNEFIQFKVEAKRVGY